MLELHDDIGILFPDVDMPGQMDGLALAALVRDQRPNVAIVIASGVLNIEQADMPAGSLFFPKPYPTSQITKALKEIAGW